jgi:2,3-bisphosphoglycerate-dependent phosphoglycerate mutase
VKIPFRKAKHPVPKLILMRHGKSIWNKENLFTGWVDVPLSEEGIQEALKGGEKIKDIPIDIIFTSTLIRAQHTAVLAMLKHYSGKIPTFIHEGKDKLSKWGEIYSAKALEGIVPVYSSWHLNERMYGKLQGLNKDDTRKKYGEEKVKIWRRSFDCPPPGGESLEMTAKRTIPYFKKAVMPHLKKGRNVFISAHGNSLRSIVMFLDSLTEEEVVSLEIPTGIPILYSFKNSKFSRDPS